MAESSIEYSYKSPVASKRATVEASTCLTPIAWPFKSMAAVDPIQSTQALIQQAIYCLEHPEQAMEIERVLDGIARLRICADDQTKALCAPLHKRAKKLATARPWSIPLVSMLLADFICHWLDQSPATTLLDSVDQTQFKPPAIIIFMRMRMLSILERIQQGLFLPLLSTPTHNGGWLAPAQLLERQQQWLQAGVTPDSYDLTLALLRIPISEREALAAQPQLHSELRNALRYIVGADSTIEQMDTALFQVALYAREPVRTSTTLNLGPGSIFDQIYEDETNRWRAIALPALRESVFAVGIRWAAKLVQDGVQSHDEGVRTYFEFLTESGAPLERKALILIAIGLIIVDRQCQRFARDAMTIAIDEGRLDTQALGREISAFLYSENSKPERLAKSLKEVARKGKLYTDAVRQVIEYALPGDPTLAPAGLIAVLELLNQLLSGNKMQNEETQKFLQSMPPGGKAGKVITELLRR